MAICTNKQERLANDLLIKLDLIKYFDFVAGSDTFDFNKPDARHLTNVVEILKGDLKKTIMVGDSEVDEMAAINAKLPFILIEANVTICDGAAVSGTGRHMVCWAFVISCV